MTKVRHPVFPHVQFDVTSESLALLVDGDVIGMLDEPEVERLLAMVEQSPTPVSDLDDFFQDVFPVLQAPWAWAAAELFNTSAEYISKQIKEAS